MELKRSGRWRRFIDTRSLTANVKAKFPAPGLGCSGLKRAVNK